MKKTYMSPSIETLQVRTMGMIAGSGIAVTLDDTTIGDLGFGGVDVSGTLDPSAHEGGLFDDDNSFDFDFVDGTVE